MEKEYFFSGYCRTLDAGRTVAVLQEDGKITEIDCCYNACPHTGSCLIAKDIDNLIKEAT